MRTSWRAFLIGLLAGFLAIGGWRWNAHRKTPLHERGLRQLEAQSLALQRHRESTPYMPVSVGSPVIPPSLDSLIELPESLDEWLALGDQANSILPQLRMSAALEGVPVPQLQAWFNQVRELAQSGTSQHSSAVLSQALSALSERWVSMDPRSAFKRVSEIPPHLSGDPLLIDIAKEHPTRVGQLLEEFPLDDTKRLTLISWLIMSWKGETPEQTTALHRAFLEKHATEKERSNFLGSSHSTKPTSLKEAEAQVAMLSHPFARDHCWSTFYQQVFDQSGSPTQWLRQAAAWKLDERKSEVRQEFYKRVAKEWLDQDPAAAIQWINELSRSERASLINQVINSKAQSRPELATALYDSLPPRDRSPEALRHIMQYWGQLDPAAAAAWHQSHEELRGQATPNEHLVSWIRSDLQAATQHLKAHPALLADMDDYDRSMVFRELIDREQSTALLGIIEASTMAEFSPEVLSDFTHAWGIEHFSEARTFAEQQVDPDVRAAALTGVAAAGRLQDYAGTLAWVQQLPQEDQLAPMIATLRDAYADPAQAAQAATHWLGFLDNEPLPSEETTKAITAVSQHYARLAPPHAADWALQLAHTEARNLSVDLVTKEWAATDPNALAEWLTTVPSSNERDRALHHLLSNIIDSPETAAAWTQEIQSDALRATWEERLQGPQHAQVRTP